MMIQIDAYTPRQRHIAMLIYGEYVSHMTPEGYHTSWSELCDEFREDQGAEALRSRLLGLACAIDAIEARLGFNEAVTESMMNCSVIPVFVEIFAREPADLTDLSTVEVTLRRVLKLYRLSSSDTRLMHTTSLIERYFNPSIQVSA